MKSLEEIIDIFNPIINKYSRILYREDTKQDLIVFSIELINKIRIDNSNFSSASIKVILIHPFCYSLKVLGYMLN
ncbi:hypothetical protein J1C67_14925 [Clostridium gasigenes]|nr:hypothetical protein [Clostridium gasigenes]QSW21490.1 hypothetical protein J1C67_14925 [Clostridium gasigenes]